jgi:hypothetical protein
MCQGDLDRVVSLCSFESTYKVRLMLARFGYRWEFSSVLARYILSTGMCLGARLRLGFPWDTDTTTSKYGRASRLPRAWFCRCPRRGPLNKRTTLSLSCSQTRTRIGNMLRIHVRTVHANSWPRRIKLLARSLRFFKNPHQIQICG